MPFIRSNISLLFSLHPYKVRSCCYSPHVQNHKIHANYNDFCSKDINEDCIKGQAFSCHINIMVITQIIIDNTTFKVTCDTNKI
jgi:hypothetical protein